MLSIDDCLKNAFAALLRGDTAGRDRWCALAQNLSNGVERVREGGSISAGPPIHIGKVKRPNE